MSDEEEVRSLVNGALSLAVARYLHDHPGARERVDPVWVDGEVEAWAARPAEEIAAEAEDRIERLDAVGDEDLDPYRTEALHARLQLQSAASGAFGSAAGALVDFLSAAGETPSRLDLF